MSLKLNKWTQKTLKLASEGNYLDKLLEVYPAELPPPRPLPEDIKNEIVKLYNEGKYDELVILLINLKDMNYPFPIEHPYAALLRHLSKDKRLLVIKRNPKAIRELANLLVSLGLNNIIRGVERPKDINRALGASFKSWVYKKFTSTPFRVVRDHALLLNCREDEICMYAGPDEKIAEFIKYHLRLNEPAEHFFDRDIIIRIRNLYIIGEARFLSTPGGSQTRDLNDTLRFVETMERMSLSIRNRNINVKGIALLDGVVWFHDPYIKQITQKAVGDRAVMSALLLEEYLLDLFNNLS